MTGTKLAVSQILSWRPEALTEQAAAWERQANDLRTRMDEQHRALDGSHETLRGAAGDAVRARFAGVHDKAAVILAGLTRGRDAARIASLNFTAAKSLVQRTKAAAEAKGFQVAEDGACTLTESAKQALYASVNGDESKYNTAIAALEIDAAAQTSFVRQALRTAAEADSGAVAAVEAAFADLPADASFGNATSSATVPRQPPENGGGTPEANRAWWDSLTAQEKSALIDTRPASIGNLDGLPVAVRDHANRNVIPLERARIEQEIAVDEALVRTDPTARGAQETLKKSRERLADLDAVRRALDDHPGTKLMLLDMTSGRQGWAALATGDPDTADHVSVTAPGLGTNLRDSVGGMVGEAEQLRQESERQLRGAGRPDESVATIAWIGYDPPQKTYADLDILNVGFEGRAQEAASRLARFYAGLEVASTNGDPHLTTLGHSYGSLTTSLALRENGRAIDDAVFYGSPGLGGHAPYISSPWLEDTPLDDVNDAVRSAADLGLEDGHVYQMTEQDDPVADFNRFGRSPQYLDWITPLSTEPLTVDGRTYIGASGHAEYPRTDPATGNLHRSGYNLAAIVAGLPENARR
ncbi:alpha/beta hydrolase [Nocardia blacklockiae]|uniref:alpha/beta hydrolase n=1 Tax=Nocardia blacklockiae TaxID=480036 RepID=UPI001894AFF9|nr:alpha/beta hydrolase [Nocardia blacklockiae]MBF6172695.1 hypothetical protein [Nocardia blacklockiae]